MSAQCPKCNSKEIFYVQASIEYHRMDTLPDDDGFCDLSGLEESYPDEDTDPYLHCTDCKTFMKLNGTPLLTETVPCHFCKNAVDSNTAHRIEDGWVGDDCCWDERLRS